MSIDVAKQISYWRDGSLEDMEVARELLEKRRYRHGLFFAHLSLEKMLKAHVSKQTKAIPPKIHTLVILAEKAGLKLPQDRENFLLKFNVYQLEGRYADSNQVPLDASTAISRLVAAEEMMGWLKAQL